jgi:hypothetical protein
MGNRSGAAADRQVTDIPVAQKASAQSGSPNSGEAPRITPAIAAGITDHISSIGELSDAALAIGLVKWQH